METLKPETNQEAEGLDVVELQQRVASLADSSQKLQGQLADQARFSRISWLVSVRGRARCNLRRSRRDRSSNSQRESVS